MRLSIKRYGFYKLWISAPNYEMSALPIYVTYNDTKIDLKITLSPFTYNEKFSEVKIIGDWNNFNLKKAAVMQKKKNGAYVFEQEVTGDTVSYQLVGVVGQDRPVNGIMANEFVDAGNGDYRSVLKVKPGKVSIVFDPSKIYKPKNKKLPKLPEISFDENHKLLGKLLEIAGVFDRTYNEYQTVKEEYQATHGDTVDFKYDYSKLQSYLDGEFLIGKELLIKEFAAIYLVQMRKMGLTMGVDKDTEIFKTIPPDSELWGIDPNLVVMFSKEFNKDATDYILGYFVMKNPNRRVQARALATVVAMTLDAGDKEGAKSLYETLLRDYEDIKDIRDDLLKLNPDKRIQNGKPVPDFVLKLIDSETVITNKDLLGKYYLIDFWATWCSHCQAEMPYLSQAYEKFHGQNFAMISVSLDKDIEDLEKFRKEKWPMPWMHEYLEDGWDSKEVFDFEVQNIPRVILVAPDGKIIAINEELKGEQLDKTLTAFMEEKEN